MTYCAYEQDEFPDTEFEPDDAGVVWHKVDPEHTTLGQLKDPEDLPGLEEE